MSDGTTEETTEDWGPLPVAMSQEDDRLRRAATLLVILSPYGLDEAEAIIKAIATCCPVSEIVPLLSCSPKDS